MGTLKVVGIIFYYLFPRISFLDQVSSNLLFGTALDLNIWEQVIHLIVITSGYVFLANFLVKKKNF
jgi:hypothetical protein